MTDESGKEKSTWWVHVDLTTVIVILVLCIGGYVLKSEYDKYHRNEIVATQKAKAEREAKEQAALEEHQRREKQTLEDLEIRNKQILEEQKARLAERERAKQQAEQKELERRTLVSANEKARQEQLELERKRQTEEIAAARARQELERKLNAARSGEDREKTIASARADHASATKEIDELQRKLEPFQTKTIAYQNKMNGAQKTANMLKQQMESAQGEHGTGLTAGAGYSTRTTQDSAGNITSRNSVPSTSSGAMVNNRAEEIAKLRTKLDAANREVADAKAGLAGIQADRDAIAKGIEDAKLKREGAIVYLKQLGAELIPATKAAENAKAAETAAVAPKAGEAPVVPVTAAPPAAGTTTYVLKDGRKIIATKSVDAGDSWSVKTEAGKFVVIQKDEIEKVEK